MEHEFQKEEPYRNVKKSQAYNGKAHNRACRKGYTQSAVKSLLTSVSGSRI